MPKYLAPHLFFLLNKGNFILWDCEKHAQFEIEIPYLKRLQEIDQDPQSSEHKLDAELLAAGVITTTPPDKQEWHWDSLSRLYHVGTKDIAGNAHLNEDEWIKSYLDFSKNIISQNDPDDMTDLPAGAEIQLSKLDSFPSLSLWQALEKRKTTRDFNGKPITEKQLSTLLFAGFGKIHGDESWADLKNSPYQAYGYRRAHPSGGALQPVQGYVIVYNVEGLDPGVYFYSPKNHVLIKSEKQTPNYEDLTYLLCGQFFCKGIAAAIVPTAHFEKAWHKYEHSRAYRDVFLDCGHLSQTILLTATALNLRTWITAWYRDTPLSSALNINKLSRAPLLFLGIGHGEDQAFPKGLD